MLDCGVAEHGSDCLCDVVITKPLPPLEECFRDAVAEMWMGREICELRGYCSPWTDDKILDYLLDVQRFGDAVANGALDDGGYTYDGRHVFSRWEYVRKAVMYRMENYEDSVVSALGSLGVTVSEFMLATSMNSSRKAWTDEEFVEFDRRMLDPAAVYMRIAADFGISDEFVYNLRKYWLPARVRLFDNKSQIEQAKEYLHQLCRETDLPANTVIEMVHSQYGKTYSRSMVCKIRKNVR